MQFFYSCDYLSRPLYNPDEQWWQHFDDPEDQWWRHFDDPDTDSWWWRHFDDPLLLLLLSLTTTLWLPQMTSLMAHVTTLMTSMIQKYNLLSPWLRPSDKKDYKLTTRMTNDPYWRCGESCVMSDVIPPHNTWWLKWWPKYDSNDPDDNGWLPWMINVMTCWRPSKFSWRHLTTPSGNIYYQSQKFPVLQYESLNWKIAMIPIIS